MWKMHQFTPAKHTLAARSLQKPCTRTAFVAGRAVRLTMDLKMAPVNGSSIRPCGSLPSERQAIFLSDDSSDKRLVQLHNRLRTVQVKYRQAAWRHSRLRNVVDDQHGAVEHKHTHKHVHILSLCARDQWRPFRHSCGRRRVSGVTAISFKL